MQEPERDRSLTQLTRVYFSADLSSTASIFSRKRGDTFFERSESSCRTSRKLTRVINEMPLLLCQSNLIGTFVCIVASVFENACVDLPLLSNSMIRGFHFLCEIFRINESSAS